MDEFDDDEDDNDDCSDEEYRLSDLKGDKKTKLDRNSTGQTSEKIPAEEFQTNAIDDLLGDS